MIDRVIRTLPFPLTSTYTLEIIKQIKAIPDENIEYTDSEIAWLNRALENLNCMITHSKSLKLDKEMIIKKTYPGDNGTDEIAVIRLCYMEIMEQRRAQIKTALAGCEQQKRRSFTRSKVKSG